MNEDLDLKFDAKKDDPLVTEKAKIEIVQENEPKSKEEKKEEKPSEKIEKEIESPKEPQQIEVIEEPKHEHSIQPAFKRIQIVEEEKEEVGSKCKECGDDISSKTRYVSSIDPEYYICELCELKTKHEHVFIKLKNGAKLDIKAYDEFCQKMIGIFAPSLEDTEQNELQEAIMNLEKENYRPNIGKLDIKKAKILNSSSFEEGIMAKRGQEIEIKWLVKNFTNREWSDDVIIICLPSSDIIVNEQKVEECLRGGDKCSVSMKFVLPKNTGNKEILGVNLCLFDQVQNKYIGEELKVNLSLIG